jgi:hypothetical protein
MTRLPNVLLLSGAALLLFLGAAGLWKKSDYVPRSHKTESQEYSDRVLVQIREEHRDTGYSFDIYHGDYPRLVVEGPQTDEAARAIEESLIRALRSAKLVPAGIDYVNEIPDADVSKGEPNLKLVRSTRITEQDAQQAMGLDAE